MDSNSINKRLTTLNNLMINLNNDIKLDEFELLSESKELILIQNNLLNEAIELSNKKKKAKPEIDEEIVPKEKRMKNEKKKEYLKKLHNKSDSKLFSTVKEKLEGIPDSNGSKYYNKKDVNIGIVADEFLFNSFKDGAKFHYITPENYKKMGEKLDIFIVATTWKGLNMEWKGLGNPNIKKHRNNIYQIINHYRSKNIETVFYSKEDPVNYDYFVDIAEKCDYIFTTAKEKVNDYKKDCRNNKVYVLDFGINPLYHNPIGMRKYSKSNDVLFAGSWYEKYPERQQDMKMIFDGIIDSGHSPKIIDRNFELKLESHFYPEKYIPYISPAISHNHLQKLHKLYNWAININTVKLSETMFANRVYELQALGNIIISNYSVGINNKFPNVFLVNDKSEIKYILDGFTDEEKYYHQIFGVRKVMSNDTIFHRLEHFFKCINFPFEIKKITVGIVVKSLTSKLKKLIESQTFKNIEIILEDNLNEIKKKELDVIAFFKETHHYGEFYIEDMVNGFKYTNSDYITKDAYYEKDQLIPGVEHDYINNMKDKYKTAFWSNSFSTDYLLKLNGSEEINNGYSIDHFEFKANNIIQEFENNKKEYKLSVIVPVYNNGDHLLNKCFNSLKRSTIFNEMEIILVDDGSTDSYTPKIIHNIERKYENVKVFFYNDGGSGSASRPRNKGFEVSTSEYITYLDPDNEAINDGYKYLLDSIVEGEEELVIGNMLKVDMNTANFDYYKTMIQFNGSEQLYEDKREYLMKSKFKAMSIQALVFKREIISRNNLKMIDGAIGEDTLFFHELLIASDRTRVINLPIHIYYAAVSGSTVNTITKKFFEKYYILEQERVKFLDKYNLKDEYVKIRFEYYFINWYIKKLKMLDKSDRETTIPIIFKLYEFYRDPKYINDPMMKVFDKLYYSSDVQGVITNFLSE